jgi:hypothetical protein
MDAHMALNIIQDRNVTITTRLKDTITAAPRVSMSTDLRVTTNRRRPTRAGEDRRNAIGDAGGVELPPDGKLPHVREEERQYD